MPPTTNIRILLIEDSELDAGLIEARLDADGVRCTLWRVQTEAEMLAALEAQQFDVILADYVLPGFDGLRALEIARERWPRLPFLFVSGMLGEDLAVQTLQQGAVDYVLKHSLHRLAPALRRALAEAREKELRHQAESALQDSDRRLRLALEAARLGTWQWDAALRQSRHDGGMNRLLGRPPVDADLPWDEFLAQVDEADRAELQAAIARTIAVQAPFTATFRVHWPDGSRHWLRGIGQGVTGAGGTVELVTGACVDVTDMRAAEDRVLRQTERLRRANEDLEQFAFSTSHDLKEPLRNVALACQMLERKARGRLLAGDQEWLDIACQGAVRMSRMLDDLLSYARVSQEALRPAEASDPQRALARVLDNLRSRLAETGGEVSHGPLPHVRVHESHLVQLLQNLLANSLQYRGERPPQVRISATATGSSAAGGGGLVTFCVADNGSGIPRENLQEVFGLFRRVQVKQNEGTGMGLAICQRIVERYGGTIWAESEPGQGARFCFTLPC